MGDAVRAELDAIGNELLKIQGQLLVLNDVFVRAVSSNPSFSKTLGKYLDAIEGNLRGDIQGPIAIGMRSEIDSIRKFINAAV